MTNIAPSTLVTVVQRSDELASEALRVVRRNVQLEDVVERLLAERKVLQERLVTEHSKVEYFQSCKEGATRKLGKQITELRAQVRTASDAADVVNNMLQTEKRNSAQLEADLERYAADNTELHRQVDMWTDLQIEAVFHNYKLADEVTTLKDFLKIKDEQCELLKQQQQELENKANTLDRELIDVGMENAQLRTAIADLKKHASFAKPQRVFAKRSHPAFPENKKRPVFAHPENVISPQRLKRAKAIVGAALEAELNWF